MGAPSGSDYQVGACFELANNIPGPAINKFFYIGPGATGLTPKPNWERSTNMLPEGDTPLGVITRYDLQMKWPLQPDVDSIAWRRQHQNGMFAITNPDTGVYEYAMHPRRRADVAPYYVDTVAFELTDGDGFPRLVTGSRQTDLELKLADGKLVDGNESWLGCYCTYAKTPTTTSVTYTGKPTLIGLFGDNVTRVKMKVFDDADASADGYVKFSRNYASMPGLVTTDGTDQLLGVGTPFTDYAVGDIIEVPGEAQMTITAIADDEHLTLSAAAVTTLAGLTYIVSYAYSGDSIALRFNRYERVALGNGLRAGISRDNDQFIVLPSGYGTLSVNDEFTAVTPRTLASPNYSTRDVLRSASLETTIDGRVYGGRPGDPGFSTLDMKVSFPKKPYFGGRLWADSNQRDGDPMLTIKLGRNRDDRVLLEKCQNGKRVSFVLNIYGNPITNQYDELWRFSASTVEVTNVTRDLPSKNVLTEDADLVVTGTWSELLRCTVPGA